MGLGQLDFVKHAESRAPWWSRRLWRRERRRLERQLELDAAWRRGREEAIEELRDWLVPQERAHHIVMVSIESIYDKLDELWEAMRS